jgi:SAM-dependent methyltransferase
MVRDAISEMHQYLQREDSGRLRYTRKAFRMLPTLDKPRILDIGCGMGGPTLQLARLSQGNIIGIDIDTLSLDELTRRINKTGLSDSVRAMNCSMFNMDFPDEGFDIIWAEGSIWRIGFERGLREWWRFLRSRGFLVVHETVWLRPNPPKAVHDYWIRSYSGIASISNNIERIPGCGYDLIGNFALPENSMWREYYGPLQQHVKELRMKYTDDPEALAVLDREQREIDLYRQSKRWYGSAFFIMQKRPLSPIPDS